MEMLASGARDHISGCPLNSKRVALENGRASRESKRHGRQMRVPYVTYIHVIAVVQSSAAPAHRRHHIGDDALG